jgi:hypothetical protein
MKKSAFLLVVLLLIFQANLSNAQSFMAFLNAGSSTVQAGLDVNHTLDQGYVRSGLSGIYTNRDKREYKIVEGHLTIGNEVVIEGLTGELGIKGLLGSVDKGFGNKELGCLAFTLGGTYQLPKAVFPVTTKIFTGIDWTPSPLAFIDTDRYFDFKLGVDVFLVKNAAMEFSYQHYNIGMNNPRDWDLKDNVFTVGVKLQF